jgi:ribonuclease BN (tRNA processing enzyme)
MGQKVNTLHFIGHSSAFSSSNASYILNPHSLVANPNRTLVRDGGPNFGFNATNVCGYSFEALKTLRHFIVTHAHQDHAGIFEDLGVVLRYVFGKTAKMYAAKEVVSALMEGPAKLFCSSLIFLRLPSEAEVAAGKDYPDLKVRPLSQADDLCQALKMDGKNLKKDDIDLLKTIIEYTLGEKKKLRSDISASLAAAGVSINPSSHDIWIGRNFYVLRRDEVNPNQVWADVPVNNFWDINVVPENRLYQVGDYSVTSFRVEHGIPTFGFELEDPLTRFRLFDSADTLVNADILARIENFCRRADEAGVPSLIHLDGDFQPDRIHADARIWYSALSKQALSRVIISHLGGRAEDVLRVSREGYQAGILGVIEAGDLVVVDEHGPRIIKGVTYPHLLAA